MRLPQAGQWVERAELLVTSWGCPPITSAVLDAAPRLRAIVHAAGSVKGHVPPDVFTRDITVTSAAAANAVPVADYTMAMLVLAAVAALERSLPAASACPAIIAEATRYSVFAGGKRLRPILAIATGEIFRAPERELLPVACSLEMIHTYSLIHDDLPAMDDDNWRRGRPTNHVVYGEAMAILAGDALLTHAFRTLTDCESDSPATKVRVISEVVRAAGTTGALIGGQVLDIQSEGKPVSAEQLEEIHRAKTGALITCAVYVISWEIAYWNFLPDFGEKYAAYSIERLRKEGASDAELLKATQKMEDFKRLYKNPLFNIGLTFLEVFPVGLIVTLVSGSLQAMGDRSIEFLGRKEEYLTLLHCRDEALARRVAAGFVRNLEVEIPIGARQGTVLRLAGEGERGMGGGPPGDLYLHLRLVPHPGYRVAGDDLEMDLPLWPWQAVLGTDVRVETPDGPVTLKVPPGTQGGRRLRLRGRGLPRAAGRGDLYAVIRIVVPQPPSAAEREAYEALRRSASVPADRPAEV